MTASAQNGGEAGYFIRADEIRKEMDGFQKKLLDTLSNVDSVKLQMAKQNCSVGGLTSDYSKMRADIRDAHEAIVAHEADLKEITSLGQAAQENTRKHCAKLEIESAKWSKALSDFQSESKVESSRLQRMIDELQGSMKQHVDELHASVAAVKVDTLRSLVTELESLRLSQTRTDQKLLDLAKADESALMEIHKVRLELEDKVAGNRREIESAKRVQSEALESEAKALAVQQAKALTEVYRIQKKHEQELASSREQVEDWRRRDRQAAGSEHEVLEQQVKKLQEALQELQQRANQLHEESRGHTDEVGESLRASLESQIVAVSNSCRKEEEKGSECLELRINESIENISTQCVSVDDYNEGLRDLRRRCQAAIAEVQSEAAAIALHEGRAGLEACKDLEGKLACQLQDQQAASADRAHTHQGDVEQRICEIAAKVANAQDDAKLVVQLEAASLQKRLTEQAAHHQSSLQQVREAFEAELQKQIARLAHADTRIEGSFNQTIEGLVEKIRLLGEQTFRDSNDLGADLRGLVTSTESRLHRILDSSTVRIDELANDIIGVKSANLAEMDRLQETLRTLQHDASLGREEVQAAKAHLANIAANSSSSSANRRHSMELHNHSEILGEHSNSVAEERIAIVSLTRGVVKIAQCIGLIGGLDGEHPETIGTLPPATYLRAEQVGLKELLEWEHSGCSLASRVEKSWLSRSMSKTTTLMELLHRKADQSTMRLVQLAVRDLDTRITQFKGEQRLLWCDTGAPRTPALVGEPFAGESLAGSFGANKKLYNQMLPPRPSSATSHLVSTTCPTNDLDGTGSWSEAEFPGEGSTHSPRCSRQQSPSGGTGDGRRSRSGSVAVIMPPSGSMPMVGDSPLQRRLAAPRDLTMRGERVESPG